jgi:hypothetical protein
MLLFIVMGLIAKLALVSGDCDNATALHDPDWNNVGISVSTCFLLSAAVKTDTLFFISFVVQFTKFECHTSDCIIEYLNEE